MHAIRLMYMVAYFYPVYCRCSGSKDCAALLVDNNNRQCWQLEARKLDLETDYRDQLAAKPDISFVQRICLKREEEGGNRNNNYGRHLIEFVIRLNLG